MEIHKWESLRIHADLIGVVRRYSRYEAGFQEIGYVDRTGKTRIKGTPIHSSELICITRQYPVLADEYDLRFVSTQELREAFITLLRTRTKSYCWHHRKYLFDPYSFNCATYLWNNETKQWTYYGLLEMSKN